MIVGFEVYVALDIGDDIGDDVDAGISNDVGDDISDDVGADIGDDIGVDVGDDICVDVVCVFLLDDCLHSLLLVSYSPIIMSCAFGCESLWWWCSLIILLRLCVGFLY